MHGAGRAMRTRLYDENDNLYKELVTDFYDFNFQDYVRTEPFKFLPGTHASVECVYKSKGEVFGLGSRSRSNVKTSAGSSTDAYMKNEMIETYSSGFEDAHHEL